MAPLRADLFRSESSSSLGSSSDERVFVVTPDPTSKRTRKRFTGSQLSMLDQLFHRTSHPSREEREALARELELYAKFFIFSSFARRAFIDIVLPSLGSPRS
jgi:hypothetical protein